MTKEHVQSGRSIELLTPLIICPDYTFDDEDKSGQGAALIILKDNGDKDTQILLALHNSSDSAKHKKWSFIGGRRKSGEEKGLATLSREIEEELNLDLNHLGVGAHDLDKILHIVEGIPVKSQYYQGEKLFTIGVFTTWVFNGNQCYPRRINTSEIIKTDFFPLKSVLQGNSGIELRDHTLPILNALEPLGFLQAPPPQLKIPVTKIMFFV